MMKKTVLINEDNNEIRYIEKREIKGDYLNTIFKYVCSSSDTIESHEKQDKKEYMLLKNGKKIYR